NPFLCGRFHLFYFTQCHSRIRVPGPFVFLESLNTTSKYSSEFPPGRLASNPTTTVFPLSASTGLGDLVLQVLRFSLALPLNRRYMVFPFFVNATKSFLRISTSAEVRKDHRTFAPESDVFISSRITTRLPSKSRTPRSERVI